MGAICKNVINREKTGEYCRIDLEINQYYVGVYKIQRAKLVTKLGIGVLRLGLPMNLKFRGHRKKNLKTVFKCLFLYLLV